MNLFDDVDLDTLEAEAHVESDGRLVVDLDPPTLPRFDETLTRLRGQPKKKKFCTVDIETLSRHRKIIGTIPYLVGFYSSKGFVAFRRWRARTERPAIVQFLDHFLTPEWAGVDCYAHNGGRFDFIPLIEALALHPHFAARGLKVSPVFVQAAVLMFTVEDPESGLRWRFLDSYRAFPASLDRMAKTFKVGKKLDPAKELGLPKDTEPGVLYRELGRRRNHAVALKYLKEDARLLYRSMRAYQDLLHGLGTQLKSTTSSISLDCQRRNFLPSKTIYVNRHIRSTPGVFKGCCDEGKKDGDKVECLGCGHLFFREAFYGGRTEIFRMMGGLAPPVGGPLGKSVRSKWDGKKLRYYDVNSHYPHCMTAAMPVGPAMGIDGGKAEDIWENLARGMVGIIRCEVEIPDDCYLPPLPVKVAVDEAGGVRTRRLSEAAKLAFPTGRFTGTWDAVELELLKEIGGRILQVEKQVWFDGKPVFVDFIETFYRYRDKKRADDGCAIAVGGKCRHGAEHDAVLAELAKLLMNGGFGKWGQREDQEKFDFGPDEAQVELLRMSLASHPELDLWRGLVHQTPEHACPQLAVHITALARSRLWRTMHRVLKEGGTLYYCDTDSMIAAGIDWPSMTGLGQWKLEHKVKRAGFIQPKLYWYECEDDCPCGWLEEKKTAEKRKAKGLRDLDSDGFFRFIDLTLAPEDRTHTYYRVAGIKESIRLWEHDHLGFFRDVEQTKVLQEAYRKRLIEPDGVATRPLRWHQGPLIPQKSRTRRVPPKKPAAKKPAAPTARSARPN